MNIECPPDQDAAERRAKDALRSLEESLHNLRKTDEWKAYKAAQKVYDEAVYEFHVSLGFPNVAEQLRGMKISDEIYDEEVGT